MTGKKRDTKTDIPRRIYKSTIDRINAYIGKEKKKSQSKRNKVKTDFNLFLEHVMDVYDHVQTAPRMYVNTFHLDASEARGESVRIAAKNKSKPQWPLVVIPVDEDGE